MNSLGVQQAATEYASRGWQVFPCKPARKIPLTTHGCKDATSDVAQIEDWWKRWPKANVALATGAQSGLVVIDIDGEDGEDTLKRLESEHGSLPDTLEARTGGGGRHLFFVHPGRKVRNQARKLGAGLDVRGDGGYVVLPPSGHPSGEHYRWLTDVEPAPIPSWLSGLVEERKRAPIPPPAPPRGASAYGKKALQEEVRKITQAPEGVRNHTLNEASFALGQLVAGGELERAEVEAHLFAAGTSSGLAAREVKATISSGLGAGQETPRKAPEKPLPVEPPKIATVTPITPAQTDPVLGVRDGESVIGEARVPGIEALVCFEAVRPRNERTGVHSELRISVGGTVYAYSNINVSRHEDRTKLANLAAENLGDKQQGKPIRFRLDHFCSNLWDWWVQGRTSEWVESTDIPDIEFLLNPYIIDDGGTIVFGYKGQGKSWLGILWTMMLEHGISTRWDIPRPRKSLFVNLERGRNSVERRRAMIGQMLGPVGWRALHRKGESLSMVWDELRSEVKRHGIEVVIVDSLSRAGVGKLTTDDDTNRAMDLLNRLGCAWVVLGHSPRADGEHLYGNVMQENAADVMIQLVGARSSLDPTSIGCRLRVKDANDLPPIAPEVYALDFQGGRLSGMRVPSPGEFPELALDASSPGDRICDLISEEGALSVEDICKGTELSRSTVYEALKASRFVRTVSGGGRGRKTVYGLRTVSGMDDPITAGQSLE